MLGDGHPSSVIRHPSSVIRESDLCMTLLAGEAGRITVVGDDDQAIYGFQVSVRSYKYNFYSYTFIHTLFTRVVQVCE